MVEKSYIIKNFNAIESLLNGLKDWNAHSAIWLSADRYDAFLMFLDWFLQRMKLLQSTNIRRLITGLLCGYALGQSYITILLKAIQIISNHLGGIL